MPTRTHTRRYRSEDSGLWRSACASASYHHARVRSPMTTDLPTLAINTIRTLVDRRHPEGELGTPGAAAGLRADGVRAVAAPPQARSARAAVVRSRSLRAVGRPRLDAALLAAPPHRLRPLARRARSSSASGAARRRATPSGTRRRASRRPPVRSGRAPRTRSAWRSPSATSRRYFNRPGHTLVDHHTYALVSDGDVMEGVACEAASLAGHLGLGKLIYLYDANHDHARRPALARR